MFCIRPEVTFNLSRGNTGKERPWKKVFNFPPVILSRCKKIMAIQVAGAA
jgi:hypothetical protein